MKLAVTGFVSAGAGSVASANALLIQGLLDRGHEIDFFSKASFVDPRPAIGQHPKFRFHDTDNSFADRLRHHTSKLPGINLLTGLLDTKTYHSLLVRKIRAAHRRRKFDLALWLGDYARGRIHTVPNVSFAQGPPGSDARSVRLHRDELIRVSGRSTYVKWRALADARLSRFGLPNFRWSDRVLVGSGTSKQILIEEFRVAADRIATVPYPIDFGTFHPPTEQSVEESERVSAATTSGKSVVRMGSSTRRPSQEHLRVLWLGRIIPRKRLDIFTAAAGRAIRSGIDLSLTVVGSVGFYPGLESYLHDFPYPGRLSWIKRMDRHDVPALMWDHDLLCQPSDEENFGSSVAEAQACGLPVIVGRTNGNSDYLSARDWQLRDESPDTLVSAFAEYAKRKSEGNLSWGNSDSSYSHAVATFSIDRVLDRVEKLLIFHKGEAKNYSG